PKSVHVEGAPSIDDAVYRGGVPILGICYGAQLVAQQLGGEVARSGVGEYGRTALEVTSSSALFGELPWQQEVWMSHADSTVAAPLVHKAIGDQLTCVFVDTGLLRMNEAEQVEETFRRQFHVDLVHAKAADRFVENLNDIADPERKRKIIGETFIRVFEEVAADHQDARFLVQGTLYPDIIESGTKDAAKIKSHHNVGGLPDDLQFELVEPLRNLFKDEVRVMGEELGLPEEIVWRQPFPGPGLAVRIVGTITPERLEILRRADAIVVEEIKRAGLYRELWQSFAVLLAVRSVGVMGDERTYAHPVVVRAVHSDDAMTADWARLPHELLDRLSSRIINEVPGVNRVAFDITAKPPGTIEWE